ncbi:NADPH-dependent FMN reductase [Haloglycomyces albus]|uniref:NADPH-dependent FMN reductase n=1 Tax=Haloglycomyces albus TaxID=526067 RepID=UPI00046D3832|nr:NAD(P)H-dependent oxidoreductase [Haloglycomyces albus]
MPTPVSVAVIPGSLRKGAFSTSVLQAALNRFDADIDATWIGQLDELPALNEDTEDTPGEKVTALREAVAAADAVLIATPEYNGMVPGHLKTAVDWVSRPYADGVIKGKPAAAFGTSPSPYGGQWAAEGLHRAYQVAGAEIVGEPVAVPQADAAVGADGQLADGPAGALDSLLEQLVTAVRER